MPPSGTVTGTVPDCPAALRLPGVGYMRLRVPEIMLLVCNFINPEKRLSHVISTHIALPVNRLRYAWHDSGAHRGGQSPPPLYPAPASKIATAWYLRLIPAGFGSGRGSVPAKHGPQPASMRAAPPSGNVSAILRPSAPAVSVAQVGKSRTGRTPPGRARRQPPPGIKAAPCPRQSPGGAALAGPKVYAPAGARDNVIGMQLY